MPAKTIGYSQFIIYFFITFLFILTVYVIYADFGAMNLLNPLEEISFVQSGEYHVIGVMGKGIQTNIRSLISWRFERIARA